MGTVTHPKPHLAIGDWRLAMATCCTPQPLEDSEGFSPFLYVAAYEVHPC